mmetsp:Transcript_39535/g.60369  ORF Transcript_39535/g.60369 Transcript_39535/m.60369 type:complete len:387 (-) Transcript_39535:75-1235(-)
MKEAFALVSKKRNVAELTQAVNANEQTKQLYSKIKQQAREILAKNKAGDEALKSGKLRVYIDGGFDLLHSGHYNALRQAKAMTDTLVVGVNSDADLEKTKGPTIMKVHERAEILRHCKFVDELIPDTVYTPDLELLKKLDCTFYAHGDDPAIDHTGFNLTEFFRQKGMLKEFRRTEGVSTTDTTGKLLALAKAKMDNGNPEMPSPALSSLKQPPKQQFLATSKRVTNFSPNKAPKEGDTIVYISGSWDMLHWGHLKRMEEARKLGDFLYVGIWDDDMTRYYKGDLYPIVPIQERVLMCLGSKHVDDVVIGAPFIITKDLITSLKIDKVVELVDYNEDPVLEQHQGIDPFSVARDLGILENVKVEDSFYDITTDQLAQRVHDNKHAF